MYIESITLRNFRCHRNREFTFTTGINGIIGKNGAGKSSIIDAIRFAFTGELDDSKDQTITAGEIDGWVRCVFVLNDKRGTIERHLSGSKVVLVYDGKRLTKAAEVKELWAELLQIDNSIFNNVVIAKQGEIPLLFTGHDASRERIFQKIFLVPNTEKIRTIIWEKYMKNCPAELLVEDVNFLQKQQAALVDQIKVARRQEEELQTKVLDDVMLAGTMSHVEFLKKCIRDRQAKPVLDNKLATYKTLMETAVTEMTRLQEVQKTINITQVNQTIDQLKASKLKQEAKVTLAHKLAELELEESRTDATSVRAELESQKKLYDHACEQRAVYGGRQDQANQSINRMKELVGKEKCPLCEQVIQDVSGFIKLLEEKVASFNHARIQFDKEANTANRFVRELQERLYVIEARKGSIKQIRDQLAALSNVTFKPYELSHQEAILADYSAREKKIVEFQQLMLGAQAAIGIAETELKGLAVYPGTSTPEEEMALMDKVISVNGQRKEELNRVRLDIARLETEYNTIDQRVTVSLANEEKNAKRNAYFNKLQQLYDMLHVSKFPRLLIESYRDVVQDILLQHIQRFDIPYRPRITEGFKIELFNSDGRVIPSVSGGQKVIVGLCLRLALHSLFAQSFPMWIVDEGTTHLDDDNEKQYFEMIRVLKTDTNIKQVIIIDHSDLLADSVDNIIRL